jgi:hypothetical protein
MGFLDKLKGKGGMKHKAIDFAKEHDDKIDQGIDKAADAADKATKGKYTDKIDNAAEKAKDAYEKPGEPQAPLPPQEPPAQAPPAQAPPAQAPPTREPPTQEPRP